MVHREASAGGKSWICLLDCPACPVLLTQGTLATSISTSFFSASAVVGKCACNERMGRANISTKPRSGKQCTVLSGAQLPAAPSSAAQMRHQRYLDALLSLVKSRRLSSLLRKQQVMSLKPQTTVSRRIGNQASVSGAVQGIEKPRPTRPMAQLLDEGIAFHFWHFGRPHDMSGTTTNLRAYLPTSLPGYLPTYLPTKTYISVPSRA